MKTNRPSLTLKVAIILALAYIALFGIIFCGWLFFEWYLDCNDDLLNPGEIIAIPIAVFGLLLALIGAPIVAISQILKKSNDNTE